MRILQSLRWSFIKKLIKTENTPILKPYRESSSSPYLSLRSISNHYMPYPSDCL